MWIAYARELRENGLGSIVTPDAFSPVGEQTVILRPSRLRTLGDVPTERLDRFGTWTCAQPGCGLAIVHHDDIGAWTHVATGTAPCPRFDGAERTYAWPVLPAPSGAVREDVQHD